MLTSRSFLLIGLALSKIESEMSKRDSPRKIPKMLEESQFGLNDLYALMIAKIQPKDYPLVSFGQ